MNGGLGDRILRTEIKMLVSLAYEVLLCCVGSVIVISCGISAKIGVTSQQEMDLLHQQ